MPLAAAAALVIAGVSLAILVGATLRAQAAFATAARAELRRAAAESEARRLEQARHHEERRTMAMAETEDTVTPRSSPVSAMSQMSPNRNSASLRFSVLLLDHDDTTVRGTEEVHYPAHVESVKALRPDLIPVSLAGWFQKNHDPGVSCYLKSLFTPELMQEEHKIWRKAMDEKIPSFYEGIPELLSEYRAKGGRVAVVSHSPAEVIHRHRRRPKSRAGALTALVLVPLGIAWVAHGVPPRYHSSMDQLLQRLKDQDLERGMAHPLMLLRFLTCTKSVEEAEEMILNAQAWRREAKVDSIMEEWGERSADGTWKLAPKSQRAEFATGLFAAERLPSDSFGGPVMLGRAVSSDMAGISRESLAPLLQNLWVFMLEDMLQAAHVASVKQRRLVSGATIIDATGISLSIVRYISEYTPWLEIMNNDYPDLVRSVIVINAPSFFVKIWSIVSLLIAPTTREHL
eukprot:g2062.t1